MYSRKIDEAPKTIISDGKAAFGTYFTIPQKIDIRGMKRPFVGIPLPAVFTNFRIKSRLAYMFSIGDYIGMVEFFDDKVFGLAEIIFWNTKTCRRYSYHTFMFARRRFVPTKTDKAICSTHKKSKNIRISWNRKCNQLSLCFDLKEKDGMPPVKGQFFSFFSGKSFAETLSVMPHPTTRRCSATWSCVTEMKGFLNVLKGKKNESSLMKQTVGFAVMVLNRTYHRYHSRREMMCALGEHDGKVLQFRFVSTSSEANDADTYNENIFSVDGKITPMPSVCITHPFGIQNEWIIQDTESMVDLTFTPVSVARRVLNIFIMRTHYNTIYGTFDGVMIDGDGNKYSLKKFPGIVKKLILRV